MGNSQKGIAATVVVLIVLLVGVVGFSGWIVYSNSSKDGEVATVQPGEFPAAIDADEIKAAEGEGAEHTYRAEEWLLFETGDYSIRLPDGWRFLHQTDGDVLYSECSELQCLTLTEGVDAVVSKIEGGRDGISGMLVVYDKNLSEPRKFDESTKNGTIVAGDLIFSVYKTTVSTESELGTPPVGTKEYIYYAKVSDIEGLYISFSQYPGVEDVTPVVEEAIQSALVK